MSRPRGKLLTRDWILLPLIGVATVVLLSGSIEFISRRTLTVNNKAAEDCMVFNDPATGTRGIPNCVCLEKIFEGEPTEYRFNSSGFRDDSNFGPKAPGIFRITMIGSSVAAGFRVPEKQTFAVLLPAELSHLTGRRVELYDEGLPWRSPEMIAHYFQRDVLWTKPDLVLWILTPEDIRRSTWRNETASPATAFSKPLNRYQKFWYYIKSASHDRSIAAAAIAYTRTDKLLSELLHASPTLYVQSSLRKNLDETSYLKSEPSAELMQNLQQFDRSATEIERETRKAGISVVIALVPDRTQVSMIAAGAWPAGFDPYKLNSELCPIVAKHGWPYIDILPDYKAIPNPQLGFFALDGHPNAAGHATISRFLANDLTAGAVPALDAIRLQKRAQTQGVR